MFYNELLKHQQDNVQFERQCIPTKREAAQQKAITQEMLQKTAKETPKPAQFRYMQWFIFTNYDRESRGADIPKKRSSVKKKKVWLVISNDFIIFPACSALSTALIS